MKRLLLSHLKSGRRGKVIEITGEDNLKQKLMHMGIYPRRERFIAALLNFVILR